MFEGQSVSSEEVVLLMAVVGEAAAALTVGKVDKTGSEEMEIVRHGAFQVLGTTYLCAKRAHGFYKSTQTIL